MRASTEWKDVRYIIVLMMYMLQFKTRPIDDVDVMCDAILQQRGGSIDFSPQQALEALSTVKGTDIDLATLIPQPHSDAVLREFFSALEEKLKAETAT